MGHTPEKPEHCIEGHIEHWYDEWEVDGAMQYEEGSYYECTEWEPGYPPLMTERAHPFIGGDYTKDMEIPQADISLEEHLSFGETGPSIHINVEPDHWE